MWNASAFDDNINSGVGFFNSSNQTDSPQAKTKGQIRRIQNVTPICIRQVKDHLDEEFKLFGMSTQILTLVGILKEVEVLSTKVTYRIEDHTGEMKAIWWLEDDANSTSNLPLVKEGCYVRVFGSLRTQDGEKILMILKMFPVDNINDVTNHLLEVIHTRLEAEEASKGSLSLAAIRQNNPGAELANSMSFMDMDVDKSSNSTGFTALQEKVYRILQPVNTQAGLDRATILSKFPTNQHRDVNAALEFLTNEGHAYSTVDNDHFKATDS
ncbi:hypothetical protein ILUMI_17045 [Ignelater luminosus]|uniref:Replication protein A C-terminal domain-containing protein n=1 Tax=Ignelater luminosus TaxID=2038154 RepID=A0A8K0CR64_IGNLU|nr:hypothetical protein ILUMI_17045 [Ignelater luminosus]